MTPDPAQPIPAWVEKRLVTAMAEFDASDKYHAADAQEPGYYAAIDRCIRLVKGEITDWQSPPTKGQDRG